MEQFQSLLLPKPDQFGTISVKKSKFPKLVSRSKLFKYLRLRGSLTFLLNVFPHCAIPNVRTLDAGTLYARAFEYRRNSESPKLQQSSFSDQTRPILSNPTKLTT